MGGTIRIPLTMGQVAIISAEDSHLASFRWQAHKTPNGFYARRSKRENGVHRRIYLHREVLGVGNGTKVDHIDRDTLNCVRSNLRAATEQQNSANRKAKRRFKGVYPAADGKFLARIGYNRQPIKIGIFETEAEAAKAYDAKARELFGEFSRTNFAVSA